MCPRAGLPPRFYDDYHFFERFPLLKHLRSAFCVWHRLCDCDFSEYSFACFHFLLSSHSNPFHTRCFLPMFTTTQSSYLITFVLLRTLLASILYNHYLLLSFIHASYIYVDVHIHTRTYIYRGTHTRVYRRCTSLLFLNWRRETGRG